MKHILIFTLMLTASSLAFAINENSVEDSSAEPTHVPSIDVANEHILTSDRDTAKETARELSYHENFFAIDLRLKDLEDVDLNKAQIHTLLNFLQNHNVRAFELEDVLIPTVRVELDKNTQEKFYWVVEHTKDFNVAHIYTYDTSANAISQKEVIPEMSGVVPFDNISIKVDKRRIRDLKKGLDARFDDRILAYGATNNKDIEEVVFEVRNSKTVLWQLLTYLSGSFKDAEVRDFENMKTQIDLEKFKRLSKSKAAFIAEDLVVGAEVKTCAVLFEL